MQPSELSQKVEDSAVELNSFILKWNKLHSSGTSVLSSVKKLKIKSMNTSDTLYEKTYPEGLQEKCNQLEAFVVDMEAAVGTLQLLAQQLTALSQLDQMQNKSYSTPFRSWSTDKFRAAFQDIYEIYSQELALKKFIKQEIAHSSNRDTLLMHVAAWDCQPFVTDSCMLICKSVFEESGVAQK